MSSIAIKYDLVTYVVILKYLWCISGKMARKESIILFFNAVGNPELDTSVACASLE